ncbi:Sensory box histidine kinase/response regulator [hydrothermal vent metagenome]|uniref:Sensory box histidine kinase/response regulator n=1 Tax=hydrothermal vent metagenome TaxID=652676 RepID=A0A1W1B9E6_9ZZZZ
MSTQDSKIEEEIVEVDLIGTEEGDFGEEELQSISTLQAPKTIKRRDVPAHEKITKNHFSEFSGQRIIVAEDNLINQKVLTGLLAGSGIEVIIANHGQEVLDILETDNDFLMILMDAHMPIIDGFEATRAIRKIKEYDHILVVALSGDTAGDDIKKMSDAGMAEQLEKPLRMETLYNIFYAYTGKKNAIEYVEVIMTKELNGDKGLEVCGGDEEFYREILSEFVQTYENSTQVLGQLLENNELQKADKLLLDIIGITANIGAEQLHAISITIKTSLSDKEERSYITLADEYKMHLENLIKDIKEYM